MPCVLTHVLEAVTVFLKETSKSFGAAAVEHRTEVQAFPGKKGTVSKPKEERSRDREVSGIACVKQLH